MRQNSNHKRPRNRGNLGRKPSNNRNQTFDSNGPSVRIRGNAYQVHEKYLALARDAYAAGDRVMAENYFQHAEHYYRIVNATTDPASGPRYNGQSNGYNGQFEDDEYEDVDELGRPLHPHGYGMRQRHEGGHHHHQQQHPTQPQAQTEAEEGEDERVAEQGGERQADRFAERHDRDRDRRRRGRRANGHDRRDDEGRQAEPVPGVEQAADPVRPEAPAPEPAAIQAASADGSDQADRPRRRRRRAQAEGAGDAPGRDADEEPVLL
jgi:hypothetical protein